MTTMIETRLPEALQGLIDARLDTIDRMLLGRLPRADRLAVTRDVEGQIFDLLGERPGHELDREDVLTVLARLDPPEAYIPEEGGYEAQAVLLPAAATGRLRAASALPEDGDRKRAMVVGIVGLLVMTMIALLPVFYLIGALFEAELFLFGIIGLSCLIAVASLPTLILSILWRRGGPWAVVGIVAGGLGAVFGPLGSMLIFLM